MLLSELVPLSGVVLLSGVEPEPLVVPLFPPTVPLSVEFVPLSVELHGGGGGGHVEFDVSVLLGAEPDPLVELVEFEELVLLGREPDPPVPLVGAVSPQNQTIFPKASLQQTESQTYPPVLTGAAPEPELELLLDDPDELDELEELDELDELEPDPAEAEADAELLLDEKNGDQSKLIPKPLSAPCD